jgi:hypothetical protein
MSTKPVQIDSTIHRDMAVRAALNGETMRVIAERGIRRELDRLAKKDSRKQLTATLDGSQAGA